MEVSVSFTDGTEDLNSTRPERSYTVEETVLGRAWIPAQGLVITRPARVRYEKHPWMEKFEFDGIRPAPARRTGIGTKDARGFVRSLSTIYSPAYDEYREYGGDEAFDAEAYFRNAAERFAQTAEDTSRSRMLAKFCGFTENMWREGNEEMLHVCTDVILPVLKGNEAASVAFESSITDEFREWLSAWCGMAD